MSRDLHNNIKVIRAIEPKAVGTTGAANGSLSPVIDRRGYEEVEFVNTFGTAAATGATITPVVYECDTTGGSFTSVADTDLLGTEAAAGLPAQATARTSGTGKNIVTKLGYKGSKPYCKIRLYGLATATGIVASTAVLHNGPRAPIA